MNENHQTQMKARKIEYYDDEIELMGYLLVIWKWKYFILAGTIFCGLIATIISFKIAKVYSIDMVLKPGILKVGEEGNNVYIDSPQNIKALIDSGTFNNDILIYLNNKNKSKFIRRLSFKITTPKNADIVNVRYETTDINRGMVVQDRLSKLLIETYSKKIQYFKNEYDMKLNLLNNLTITNKTTIQSHKKSIEIIAKRIDELENEVELAKKNTVDLIGKGDNLISTNLKEDNILSALLYSNIIQQKLGLLNFYQNELNYYKLKKEDELQKIKEIKNDIANNLIDIKSLQVKKDHIQNIQVLRPPTRSTHPIKPKTLSNVISALFIGLFLTIFLTFLLEYISKHKKRKSL